MLDWCRHVADQGLGALGFPEDYGGENDMERFITVFEMLAYHDLSLVIKFGVQFGLFGGSIDRLGSEHHREKYLDRVGTLELPGCFAMTEWGHGSNVRELETTARYDPEREEFVVNTPHDGARKEWIGNAAAHGQMATVFAQLETNGEEHGVHAFLVPVVRRSAEGTPGTDCQRPGRGPSTLILRRARPVGVLPAERTQRPGASLGSRGAGTRMET